VNSLLQAKRVLVDCRGLESALEAVSRGCESVSRGREKVDRGLGLKRSLRMSVEAVRV
jgi:hypothetical protein